MSQIIFDRVYTMSQILFDALFTTMSQVIFDACLHDVTNNI